MAVPNIPNLILSHYLIKNCNLWIWDFDDTIITTEAYLKHNMDENTINNLSDKQLLEDVPYYPYFRKVVEFLYMKGRKVGIASFGVYTIIQAYMNRIFGMNQKYFDANNVKAFRRNRDDTDIRKKLPLNKNSMIYDIMEFYKISTFTNVCLFDDAPNNIADAMAIGIVGVQIDCLFNPEVMPMIDAKMTTDTSNTHPLFYSDGQRKIWKNIPVVNGEAILCNPDVTYKTVGTTKKCLKKKLPIDLDLSMVADDLPIPTLDGTVSIKKYTGPFTTRPASDIDYQTIVKTNFPGIAFNKKFIGNMTYQEYLDSQTNPTTTNPLSNPISTNNTSSNTRIVETFDDCIDCNDELNKKINLIVMIGLILGLVIFIWRIHKTNESQVMMVWSLILLFVILTLALSLFRFKKYKY